MIRFYMRETAYEVRISDWSSDVCSSVLPAGAVGQPAALDGFGARPAILDIEAADDLGADAAREERALVEQDAVILCEPRVDRAGRRDRKSTRLNSSH